MRPQPFRDLAEIELTLVLAMPELNRVAAAQSARTGTGAALEKFEVAVFAALAVPVFPCLRDLQVGHPVVPQIDADALYSRFSGVLNAVGIQVVPHQVTQA